MQNDVNPSKYLHRLLPSRSIFVTSLPLAVSACLVGCCIVVLCLVVSAVPLRCSVASPHHVAQHCVVVSHSHDTPSRRLIILSLRCGSLTRHVVSHHVASHCIVTRFHILFSWLSCFLSQCVNLPSRRKTSMPTPLLLIFCRHHYLQRLPNTHPKMPPCHRHPPTTQPHCNI